MVWFEHHLLVMYCFKLTLGICDLAQNVLKSYRLFAYFFINSNP